MKKNEILRITLIDSSKNNIRKIFVLDNQNEVMLADDYFCIISNYRLFKIRPPPHDKLFGIDAVLTSFRTIFSKLKLKLKAHFPGLSMSGSCSAVSARENPGSTHIPWIGSKRGREGPLGLEWEKPAVLLSLTAAWPHA